MVPLDAPTQLSTEFVVGFPKTENDTPLPKRGEPPADSEIVNDTVAVLGAETLNLNVAPPSAEVSNKLAEPLESTNDAKSDARPVVAPLSSMVVTVQTMPSRT